MFVTQCLRTASILLVISAAVAGAGLVAPSGTPARHPRLDEKAHTIDAAPAFVVQARKLKVSVVERGHPETVNSSDLFCSVEAGARITWIVGESTKFK
jgi:hypothetical protein